MAKEYSVYELNRIQQYIMQMRPVLKKEALFSDGTKITAIRRNRRQEKRWRSVSAPEGITWISSGFAQIVNIIKWKNRKWSWIWLLYGWDDNGRGAVLLLFRGGFRSAACLFDRYGVSKERRDAYRFCIIPGFSTPEWSKEPSCTRSLWIVFTMVIRLTMCWRMSTIISRHRVKNGGLESVSVRFFCWRVLRRRFRGRETEVKLLTESWRGSHLL